MRALTYRGSTSAVRTRRKSAAYCRAGNATHILAFEGDSQVVFFEGSYSEYEENKRKRLGDDTPHRVKYRKLLA